MPPLGREHSTRTAAAGPARGEEAALGIASASGARGPGVDLTRAGCQGDDLAPGVALALARGLGVDLVPARGLNVDLVRARRLSFDLVPACER